MKNKTKVLLTSLATIAMSASLAVGGTYALFTSEDSVNIAVTAGTVEVTAKVKSVETGSTLSSENAAFTAVEKDGEITLNNMIPGDYVTVTIDVENTSTVDVLYKLSVTESGDLAPALEATYNGSVASTWEKWTVEDEDQKTLTLTVYMPEEISDKTYHGATGSVSVSVQAVQGNASNLETEEGKVEYMTAGTSEELATAIATVADGGSVGVSGEVALSGSLSKNVTFIGLNDGAKLDLGNKAHTASGLDVTFKGLTLLKANVNYAGLHHSASETYVDCTIEGELWTYATEATFENCTFSQTDNDKYNIWTYGATTVNFDNCTFNSAGKSVLIYQESRTGTSTVNFNGCELYASEAVDGKAAIEIDASFPNGTAGEPWYDVNIKDTIAAGFDKGSKSADRLYNVKKGDRATVNVENSYGYAAWEKVDTAAELAAFASSVNEGETYADSLVTLEADIDLNSAATYSLRSAAVANWTPVEIKTKGLVFDGKGHVISNLVAEGTECVGLFSAVYGATIKNVVLDNASVSGNHYVGGIAGYLSSGSIENCKVVNSTISATPNAVENGYDNGDKVGGIVGFLYNGTDSTKSVVGCSVENITLKAYRDVGGIAGLALASDVKNCSASDVTINVDQVTNSYGDKDVNANYIVGRLSGTLDESNTVSGNNGKNLTLNGGMEAALANGGNVTLEEDVESNAENNESNESGYGKSGVSVVGGVLDGNNNTLTTTGANSTWDCAVYTKGGTIKNLTIVGGFRGIFIAKPTSDIIIDNVHINDSVYTISADSSNGVNLVVKNSTLNGWTSYTSGFASVSIENCSLGKDTGGYGKAFFRPYTDTTLTNCEFSEGYTIDTDYAVITLVNCTLNGVLITPENLSELVASGSLELGEAPLVINNN